MKTKKKVVSQQLVNEDTAASASIEAKPSDASKSAMMLDIMNLCQWMDKDKMSEALAQMQNLSAPTDGMAAGNAASIQPKGNAQSVVTQAMKEDVDALFGSQELSEEFKAKASTLFEAAVSARMALLETELVEQYQAALSEQVEEITVELTDQIDKYLTHVAESWMEENQVAIDNTLRAELAEDFISGLHKLFAEHYITVPAEKIDVVEALAQKNEQLEQQLNDAINQTLEMEEVLEKYAQEEIFNEVAEGLALTQIDKLKKLTEGVTFADVDEYKQKLAVIKEHHFAPKATKQADFEPSYTEPQTLTEQVEEPTDPVIRSYHRAIARTVRNNKI